MFKGADVDGLDRMAQKVDQAVGFAQTVLAVLRVTIAALRAMSWTGWAAAFATYLQTVVVPWVQTTLRALQAFSAVLKFASSQQKEVSGDVPRVSLPTPRYETPKLPPSTPSNPPMLATCDGARPADLGGTGSNSVRVTAPTLPGPIVVNPGNTGSQGGGSTVSTPGHTTSPTPSGPSTGGTGTPQIITPTGPSSRPDLTTGTTTTPPRVSTPETGPTGTGFTGSLSGTVSRNGHTGTFDVTRNPDGSWSYDLGASGTLNRPDAPVGGGSGGLSSGGLSSGGISSGGIASGGIGSGGGGLGAPALGQPGAGIGGGGSGISSGSGSGSGFGPGSGMGPGSVTGADAASGAGTSTGTGAPGLSATPIVGGGGIDGATSDAAGSELPHLDSESGGNPAMLAAPLGLAGLAGLGAAALGKGLLGGSKGGPTAPGTGSSGSAASGGTGGSAGAAAAVPDEAWSLEITGDGAGGHRLELSYTGPLAAGLDPLGAGSSAADALDVGTDVGRVDAWIDSDGNYQITADNLVFQTAYGEVVIDDLHLTGNLHEDDPATAAAIRGWWQQTLTELASAPAPAL